MSAPLSDSALVATPVAVTTPGASFSVAVADDAPRRPCGRTDGGRGRGTPERAIAEFFDAVDRGERTQCPITACPCESCVAKRAAARRTS